MKHCKIIRKIGHNKLYDVSELNNVILPALHFILHIRLGGIGNLEQRQLFFFFQSIQSKSQKTKPTIIYNQMLSTL